MLILGTIIISILCIVNYAINRKATDALFTFTIALLTLFTVSSDNTKIEIFLIIYPIITTVIFSISSYRSYVSNKVILLRASVELYGGDNKTDEHIKGFFDIEKKAESKMLKAKERCNIILFFAERRMPPENYASYIVTVDDIASGADLTPTQACEIIYFLFKLIEAPINHDLNIPQSIKLLFDSSKSLPISRKAYYELILDLRDIFLTGKKDFNTIINDINNSIKKGHTLGFIAKRLQLE